MLLGTGVTVVLVNSLSGGRRFLGIHSLLLGVPRFSLFFYSIVVVASHTDICGSEHQPVV
jgi:hypothetical protein